MHQVATDFRAVCRRWREHRKLSQLELALAANVSQRHLSWLETGRSKPSRDMVVRLAEAMAVPLRERNVMLRAAGFTPAYRESALDEPAMAPVLDALNQVLDHHDPLPAVVVDRAWNVVRRNTAAGLLLSLGGDPGAMLEAIGGDGQFNLALLTLHPEGLRPFIANWDQAAPAFVRRLQHEALASGDPALQARFAEYIALADLPDTGETVTEALLPVLPLEVCAGPVSLSLFSVISTFGTPQDVTTDELRIETFYPTDAATRAFFEQAATLGAPQNG
ncbi:MAG: helix-turn-helix transcriptional regulator [Pseudomonadota bacterium]